MLLEEIVIMEEIEILEAIEEEEIILIVLKEIEENADLNQGKLDSLLVLGIEMV